MTYIVSSLKIHCYSFSVNLGKSHICQAPMTYNTHVLTVCDLALKRGDSADNGENELLFENS